MISEPVQKKPQPPPVIAQPNPIGNERLDQVLNRLSATIEESKPKVVQPPPERDLLQEEPSKKRQKVTEEKQIEEVIVPKKEEPVSSGPTKNGVSMPPVPMSGSKSQTQFKITKLLSPEEIKKLNKDYLEPLVKHDEVLHLL